MDIVKELVVDFFILVAAWFLVTASGISNSAKGLTCGRVETSAQVHP